ncbi:MAG TPA: hypothetical protein VN238_09900 [Solirubrobacteraceae bacterium]|nr:hypothetical protein [Solirubrobacteraceae bacterium]
MNEAQRELLNEIRRRLAAAKDAPEVQNANGSNYWAPYVTRAVDKRADDGPALVAYIQSVLRKPDRSEGWSALLEAGRLDLSFEDMVANADEPIRSLFTDEDREIAGRTLAAQTVEVDRRREAAETTAVDEDRRIVARVAASRRAAGKPWTDEIEAQMFADRAERRRKS